MKIISLCMDVSYGIEEAYIATGYGSTFYKAFESIVKDSVSRWEESKERVLERILESVSFLNMVDTENGWSKFMYPDDTEWEVFIKYYKNLQ